MRSCLPLRVRPLFIFKKLSGRIKCPSADRYRNVYLVFTICNVPYITIPTGPAITARVPLVRSWAASSSCNDRGSQGPGARRGSVYLRRAKPYCQVSWHPVLRDLRKEPGLPRGKPVRHVWRHATDLEYF